MRIAGVLKGSTPQALGPSRSQSPRLRSSRFLALAKNVKAVATALTFLASAKNLLLRSLGDWLREGPSACGVEPLSTPAILIAEPVPMPMVRLAGRERAQLLLESPSRPLLQAMLGHYLPALRALSLEHSRVHWHLEVDPLAI